MELNNRRNTSVEITSVEREGKTSPLRKEPINFNQNHAHNAQNKLTKLTNDQTC